jgi:hypothetical protein
MALGFTSKILTMLSILVLSVFAVVFQPVSAQNTNAVVTSNYDLSYKEEDPGVTKPVTVELENHLYHPGESVEVHGFIWMDIVNRIDALDIVKVEIKDNAGNVVARENATLVRSDGSYSTSLKLLDNAAKGTYAAESRVELAADALGIVQAITSATLQSSNQFAVAASQTYPVNAEGKTFTVSLASNSGINDFEFKQSEKRVSFFVEGEAGTEGVTEITIPKDLLSGDMSVFMDQNLINEDDVIVKSETNAATTFEINYHHSIHRMEVAGTNVVPEFPLASLAIISGAIGVMLVLTRTLPIFRRL